MTLEEHPLLGMALFAYGGASAVVGILYFALFTWGEAALSVLLLLVLGCIGYGLGKVTMR
jgi:hypothetical protein